MRGRVPTIDREQLWTDSEFLAAEFWAQACKPGRRHRLVFGPPHDYVFKDELRGFRLMEDCRELRIALELAPDAVTLLDLFWKLEKLDCMAHYIAIGERLGDAIEYGPVSCLCNPDDDNDYIVRCHLKDPWGRPWQHER